MSEPRLPPESPDAWSRLFTVAEANALLPELVPVLTDLQRGKAELDELRGALDLLTPAMRGNGHGAEAATIEQRLHEVGTGLASGIRSITEQGIEVKDLDHGLIDFPSLRDDHVVFLCWRLGEGPVVAYWHEIRAGFAGRHPL